MTESPQETHPLPYAEPATRAPTSPRLNLVVIVNALAAAVSLRFVPLAVHIYSCTESQKWCHLQALMFGLPSLLLWVVLLAFTASTTLAPQASTHRSKSLKLTAWLLLTFAAIVLIALFSAVVHNSK